MPLAMISSFKFLSIFCLCYNSIYFELIKFFVKERMMLSQNQYSSYSQDIITNQLLKDQLPDVPPGNIDAICGKLMDPNITLYWDYQPDCFKQKLKRMLQENKDTESIFQELMRISADLKEKNLFLAHQAGVFGKQILDSSIGNQQLVSENVQRLVDLIDHKISKKVEILSPINQADGSAHIIIEAANNELNTNNFDHVMFAFGAETPRHWYWVTISKLENQGAAYAVEVFDPLFCELKVKEIYQFLELELIKHGITPIAKTPFVKNGMIVPQIDGYSCGYYAAAYAHLKVQQLDDKARCNQDMIDALKRHGNSYHNPYLRDMCLHAVNPSECPKPKYSNQLGTHFWSNQELSSRSWNRRGVQWAFYSTLFVEAAIVGLSFIPTIKALLSTSIPVLSSVGIPPLFLIMLIAAVATIYVSNRYEPIVIDTSNRPNLFAV